MKNASRHARRLGVVVAGALSICGSGQPAAKAAPGDPGQGPPPAREDRGGEQRPGERGRGGPGGGVQRAIESLQLSEADQQKVAPILEEFRQKEQEVREELLAKMKQTLTADQFTKFEAAMRRPPGPPPGEQRRPEGRPEGRGEGRPEGGADARRDRRPEGRPDGRPDARPDPQRRPGAPPAEREGADAPAPASAAAAVAKDADQVPVTLTGGYETDPQDHGRPVVLIAAALGVPSEVFRKAFSNVHPAGPGKEPEPEQVRKNKATLMQSLSPYGITNDRLDEVSNYYRYSSSRGQMWRHTSATAYATIKNGKVIRITITQPGSGYSSAPAVSVPGMQNMQAAAHLTFGKEFTSNGSIKEITLTPE